MDPDSEISLRECLDFLTESSHQSQQQDHPIFIASNCVMSFDGILSFWDALRENGEGGFGPEEIALRHYSPSESKDDWRMLNAGWMLADAVLLTAKVLLCEPNVLCVPQFADMKNYRRNELKLLNDPLHVLLVGHDNYKEMINNLDPRLPIFIKAPCLIALRRTGFPDEASSLEAVCQLKQRFGSHIDIRLYGKLNDDKDGAEFFIQILRELHDGYGVRRLEVNTGGRVISRLVELGLLQEMRITVTGQLAGPLNCRGEQRPSIFPSRQRWIASENPHLIFQNVRLIGPQMIMFRCRVINRRKSN